MFYSKSLVFYVCDAKRSFMIFDTTDSKVPHTEVLVAALMFSVIAHCLQQQIKFVLTDLCSSADEDNGHG